MTDLDVSRDGSLSLKVGGRILGEKHQVQN